MKELYRERQWGWIILGTMVPMCVWMGFAYRYQWGNNPMPILILLLVVFFGCIYVFAEMTTVVYEDRLVVSYGFGLLRFTFPLNELSLGECRKIPWYAGAGIKCLNDGRLFSVGFTNAAQFRNRVTGKVVAIGTPNPERLIVVVNAAIERKTLLRRSL